MFLNQLFIFVIAVFAFASNSFAHIVGEDKREEVPVSLRGEDPYSSVVKIYGKVRKVKVKSKDGQEEEKEITNVCSGFVIKDQPNKIFTPKHCVKDLIGREIAPNVYEAAADDPDTNKQQKRVTIFQHRIANEKDRPNELNFKINRIYVENANEDLANYRDPVSGELSSATDWAVIETKKYNWKGQEKEISNFTGWLDLESEPHKKGYDAMHLQVVSYAVDKDNGTTLQQQSCEFKQSLDDGTVLTDCDIIGGSSGGPMMACKKKIPLAVGYKLDDCVGIAMTVGCPEEETISSKKLQEIGAKKMFGNDLAFKSYNQKYACIGANAASLKSNLARAISVLDGKVQTSSRIPPRNSGAISNGQSSNSN